MKHTIKVPPSSTEQTVIVDVPDITFSHTITGGTPIVTPPVEEPPVVVPPSSAGKIVGFGANAKGGEGKEVIDVTTLTSSMIRSNRVLRFTKDATITGRFNITNVSYLTIDANGFDVTIDNNNNGDGISVGSGSHHIILNGLRVIDAGNDCINVVDGANNIAIINCTTAQGTDGGIDLAGGYNITVQNCIMFPNKSGEGAMLITAKEVSVIGCVFAHVGSAKAERSPMVHANYSPVGNPNVDFVNNLVWKHGRYGSGVGYRATGNFVNNYYYPGSESAITIEPDPGASRGNIYASGNVSASGTNLNNNGNRSSAYVVPDWAKVPAVDAVAGAKAALQNAGTAKKTSQETNWLNSITIK
jgi:hypothetical protein